MNTLISVKSLEEVGVFRFIWGWENQGWALSTCLAQIQSQAGSLSFNYYADSRAIVHSEPHIWGSQHHNLVGGTENGWKLGLHRPECVPGTWLPPLWLMGISILRVKGFTKEHLTSQSCFPDQPSSSPSTSAHCSQDFETLGESRSPRFWPLWEALGTVPGLRETHHSSFLTASQK